MDSFLVTYDLEPQVESIDRAVDLLLHEMTSGIQYYSARDGAVMDRVRDHVPFVDPSVCGEVVSVTHGAGGSYRVSLAFPASNLDSDVGGITNLWPIIAGEVFNFYFIKRARLLDVRLPPVFASHYRGPGFGIAGIRQKVGVASGPLFGAIIKPNLGLNPRQAASVAASLAEAGFDFIKDDEIAVNPSLCPLRERVSRVVEALGTAGGAGRRVLYMANVTSDFASLKDAAVIASDAGAGGFMLDPFCTGISSIDYLRRTFSLPIYCHRVGYGLSCLGSSYSVSYQLFSKLFRLLGADFSHVGGIWGGAEDARTKVARYLEVLRGGFEGPRIGETWPVVSGISTENMEDYYGFYGDDTLYLEHIDIYGGTEAARRKLAALKACVTAGAMRP